MSRILISRFSSLTHVPAAVLKRPGWEIGLKSVTGQWQLLLWCVRWSYQSRKYRAESTAHSQTDTVQTAHFTRTFSSFQKPLKTDRAQTTRHRRPGTDVQLDCDPMSEKWKYWWWNPVVTISSVLTGAGLQDCFSLHLVWNIWFLTILTHYICTIPLWE